MVALEGHLVVLEGQCGVVRVSVWWRRRVSGVVLEGQFCGVRGSVLWR